VVQTLVSEHGDARRVVALAVFIAVQGNDRPPTLRHLRADHVHFDVARDERAKRITAPDARQEPRERRGLVELFLGAE